MSRHKRAVLIGITLIGTALLVWLDRDFVAPRWSDLLTQREQTLATDGARYHGGSFPVIRVVDGDTLHLGVADAEDEATKVRLVGVDAPEMGWGGGERMYYAEEATAFVRRLAMGQRVTVYLDQQAGSRDRYGRLLAYIQLPDGKFLNEELLSEGFAYADHRFKHGYYQKYQQLEASARALKQGLWARVRPEQMPAWRQKKQAQLEPSGWAPRPNWLGCALRTGRANRSCTVKASLTVAPGGTSRLILHTSSFPTDRIP